MHKLKIITSTVREGRKGPLVAEWVASQIRENNKSFEVELIDLGEIDLPLSREPYLPVTRNYQHPQTIRWSETIDQASAFVFILGEYNHSFPAPLKNALDTLTQEWTNKPAAIVSYGGISGGTRAASAIIPTMNYLGLKIVESPAISFPFFEEHINKESGKFSPPERNVRALQKLSEQLLFWTAEMALLREKINAGKSDQ